MRRLTKEAFGTWLRTGRVAVAPLELKFNGWHDTDDGRFTHVGTGRFFPKGSSGATSGNRLAMARPPKRPEFGGGGGSSGEWSADERNRRGRAGVEGQPSRTAQGTGSTRNVQPQYELRKGDTLFALARRAQITVPQLAAANDIAEPNRIKAGDKLTLPDRSDTNPDWVVVRKDQLRFELDEAGRTRLVEGQLGRTTTERSRTLQLQAGDADRRPSDDGGHFIAPRFGGPKEAYNHFAQNANFNRGR